MYEQSRDTRSVHRDIQADLTPLEERLLASHDLVTVRGKCGRPVPVLIPDDCKPGMEYLSDLVVREAAGVNGNNIFFFANTGENTSHV